MGLLQRLRNALIQKESLSPSVRYISLPAGVHVTHDAALTYSAVWAAVKVITETLGVLSYHLFERNPDGSKTRRDDLFLDHLLRHQPNPEMTSQQFREVLTAHCMLWGNGYAEIVRDGAGRPSALWPLLPDRMTPNRAPDGSLVYEYRVGRGQAMRLDPQNVFHLKGLGFDGVRGYDVISYAAMTIGVGMASEEHTASFFKNGAQLEGVLTTEQKLDKEGRSMIREAFEETYKGTSKSFRVGVFDRGLKYDKITVSPEASQLIQNRKYSVTDVARIFRIPPHMVGDLEKATFSNIEQQSIDFVMHTILPWAVRWEQEGNSKLVAKQNRRRMFTKMNINSLMRGDMKSRFESYRIGREWGWLNGDDIRALEDMDPIGGVAGSTYIVPLNYQDAERLKDEPKPPEPTPSTSPEPPEGEGSQGNLQNLRPVLIDAANRIANREHHTMAAKLTKYADDADGFQYEAVRWFNRHGSYVRDALEPVLSAMLGACGTKDDGDSILRRITDAYTDRQLQKWLDANSGAGRPDPADSAFAIVDEAIDLVVSSRALLLDTAA